MANQDLDQDSTGREPQPPHTHSQWIRRGGSIQLDPATIHSVLIEVDYAGLETHVATYYVVRPHTCGQCGAKCAEIYADGPTAARLCVKCRFPKLFLRLTGG